MISMMKTGKTITLFIEGENKPRVLQASAKTPEIVNRVNEINKTKSTELLHEFLQFIAPIRWLVFKDTRFKLSDDNKLYLEGYLETPIFGFLSNRIMEFIDEGYPVDYLIEFWKNCLANPKQGAIEELFEFLEENNYPITPDGCFIGYKKVRSIKNQNNTLPSEFTGLRKTNDGNVRDFRGHFVGGELRKRFLEWLQEKTEAQFVDSHTGTIKQSIGDVVSIPRESCDFNRNNTCSAGLHVGSYSYSRNFSGNTFIYVKVNPMNVVAVPPAYDAGKLRCCEYTIVGLAEEKELEVKIF